MRVRLAPQAFPKNFRLLSRAQFRRVYDEGQRRSAPLCTIFFSPNGLTQTRLGITTPRAVGNAVERNRVRRRLREIFRRNRAGLPRGWDVVLNPRSKVLEAPFATLEREVLRLFPRQSPATSPPASAAESAAGSARQP